MQRSNETTCGQRAVLAHSTYEQSEPWMHQNAVFCVLGHLRTQVPGTERKPERSCVLQNAALLEGSGTQTRTQVLVQNAVRMQ